MRIKRFLAVSTLVVGLCSLAGGVSFSADTKAEKKLKQEQKKLANAKKAEEARKAEDAKKAEEVKKAAEAKKADYAAKPDAKSLAPLKPVAIGSGKDAPAVARAIDAQIGTALSANKLVSSPLASDAEFLRRVSLDIVGIIPTAERAKAFLDDASINKRAKLIDELLSDSKFGRRQADIWTNLLIQKSSDNRRVDFSSFRTWMASEFNKGEGWDKIVSNIVTATGGQDKNPAVGFFLSNNTVDKMTDEICKTFLGVQLQCAQCHNHPFTAWKQTEYWAMAQFFMKVDVGGLGKDASPSVAEVTTVRRNAKNNTLPESAKMVPAKFLQADPPSLSKSDLYRPVLTKWMTSNTNPFFARAMVNRTWSEFFGRGFVNPVDDMHEGNAPSHPELLSVLEADFAGNGFDIKHLIRSICLSETYQRSSKPMEGNEEDDTYFSHMTMKVLTPEQLFDSLASVTGFTEGKGQAMKGANAGKGARPATREQFVTFFLAGAEQASVVDYDPGIPQALRLMNSRIAGNPAALRSFVGGKPADVIEKMYLGTVSRRPTAEETAKFTAYVAKASTPAEAYGDILWALLNSSEFTLNR